MNPGYRRVPPSSTVKLDRGTFNVSLLHSPYKNVSNCSLPSRSFFSQPYIFKHGLESKKSTFVSVLALSCNGLFLSWYNKNSIPRSVIQDLFIFWLLKSIPSWDIFIEFVCLFVLPGKPNYIWEAVRTYWAINMVCRTRKIQVIYTLTHFNRCLKDSQLSERDICYHFLYL